jgi:hypothetical protein
VSNLLSHQNQQNKNGAITGREEAPELISIGREINSQCVNSKFTTIYVLWNFTFITR